MELKVSFCFIFFSVGVSDSLSGFVEKEDTKIKVS